MKNLSSKKSKVAGLLSILTLSSVTMLVLLWRFPLTTAVVTLAVLVAFAISARLARSIDVDMSADRDAEQRGV